MVNIFFIHRFPFSKDAFIKDDFEFFRSQGYNVKCLDISLILKKIRSEILLPDELEKFVIRFDNKNQFENFLRQNPKSLIVSDVGLLLNSAWMYYLIFKYRIPHISIESPSMPRIVSKSKSNETKDLISKNFRRFTLGKLINKPLQALCYVKAKLIFKPAIMIISSKQHLNTGQKTLYDKNTMIKITPSTDYLVAQTLDNNSAIVEDDYAVFLDQYFVHHPDFKTKHIISNFDAASYYGELNHFLDVFSKQIGMRVVIASHPRRSGAHKLDFLDSFDQYYNQTAALIRNSKIVLLHFSTALNFAILFNKPFLLLTSNLFKYGNINDKINKFADFFDKKPINLSHIDLSECIQRTPIYEIDSYKYQLFYEKFIKIPSSSNKGHKDYILEIIQILESNV